MPLQDEALLSQVAAAVIDRPNIDISEINNLFTNQYFKTSPVLKKLLQQENQGPDFTLPGFSYMGPGTRTIDNLTKFVKPINNTDLLALHHDVAYALDPSIEGEIKADASTIYQAFTTPVTSLGDVFSRALMIQGLNLKLALTANPVSYLISKMMTSNEPTLEEKRTIEYLEKINTGNKPVFSVQRSLGLPIEMADIKSKSLDDKQSKAGTTIDISKGGKLNWTKGPMDDPTTNLLKFRNRFGSIGM